MFKKIIQTAVLAGALPIMYAMCLVFAGSDDDIGSFTSSVAEMNQEYPVETKTVKIDLSAPDGYEEIQGLSSAEASTVLEEEGYKVTEIGYDTLEVEDVYSSCRLIVIANGPLEVENALSYTEYDGQYVIQYDSPDKAKQAYMEFQEDPLVDCIEVDQELELGPEEPMSREDTEVVLSMLADMDSFVSWGSSYMNFSTVNQYLEEQGMADTKVTVAVLDSGLYTDNYLLEGRFEGGYDLINDTSEMTDDVGHGTAVAGIIADASLDNVVVAPYKVFSSNTSTMSTVMTGMNRAISDGVDVINLSLGSTDDMGEHPAFDKVISKAVAQNIPVIASAGNSSESVDSVYPARNDEVFCITAIDDDGSFASYSNYGDKVDYCAPGSDIRTTYNSPDMLAISGSGTSFAAPHVSAAAAALKMYDRDMSVDEIRQIFDYSVNASLTAGEDPEYYGAGCIDMAKVADYLENPPHIHTWVEVERAEASCEQDGYIIYNCTCGESYTETLPMYGHQWEVIETVDPTCEENGSYTYECSICHDKKTEEILLPEHTEEIYVIDSEASTKTILYCSCGDVFESLEAWEEHCGEVSDPSLHDTYVAEQVEVPAEGHWDTVILETGYGHDYQVTETVEASCITSGKTTYTCSRCNDSFVVETAPTGHSFQTQENARDCEAVTYDIISCENCAHEHKIAFSPIGHDYQESERADATCLSAGFVVYTCTRCGDSYEEEIPQLGHDYVLKASRAATESEDGYETYVCSNCKQVDVHIIPKTKEGTDTTEQLVTDRVGTRILLSTGSYLTNEMKSINEKYYYLDENGYAIKSRLISYRGKTYYFDRNGLRVSGWAVLPDGRHYFTRSGAMVTGTTKIDGVTYVFDKDGVLSTKTE